MNKILNNEDDKHVENCFYKHFVETEKIRRSKALELFNNQDYSKLCKNYIHYLKTEDKSIEIENHHIDNVIEQLIKIKNELPKNTTSVFLDSYIEDEDCMYPSNEVTISVSWIEYSILNESKCLSLAGCWARDSAFKMKRQPEGTDGKRAIELYKKLTKREGEEK